MGRFFDKYADDRKEDNKSMEDKCAVNREDYWKNGYKDLNLLYTPPLNKITVRWFDGYLEEFTATEVRFSGDILWMRLSSGQERIIPLTKVRWFSQSIESHQKPIRGMHDAIIKTILK